jgi:hypothetical protein
VETEEFAHFCGAVMVGQMGMRRFVLSEEERKE